MFGLSSLAERVFLTIWGAGRPLTFGEIEQRFPNERRERLVAAVRELDDSRLLARSK